MYPNFYKIYALLLKQHIVVMCWLEEVAIIEHAVVKQMCLPVVMEGNLTRSLGIGCVYHFKVWWKSYKWNRV